MILIMLIVKIKFFFVEASKVLLSKKSTKVKCCLFRCCPQLVLSQDLEGRSRDTVGSHRQRHARQGSLGGFEGRQAQQPPQEVGSISMGVHRFPQAHGVFH